MQQASISNEAAFVFSSSISPPQPLPFPFPIGVSFGYQGEQVLAF